MLPTTRCQCCFLRVAPSTAPLRFKSNPLFRRSLTLLSHRLHPALSPPFPPKAMPPFHTTRLWWQWARRTTRSVRLLLLLLLRLRLRLRLAALQYNLAHCLLFSNHKPVHLCCSACINWLTFAFTCRHARGRPALPLHEGGSKNTTANLDKKQESKTKSHVDTIQEIGDGIALRKRVLANLETGPLFLTQIVL